VGATTLKYRLRAIDDLAGWLRQGGDGVPLGAADASKPAAEGTVEAVRPPPSCRCRPSPAQNEDLVTIVLELPL